MEDFGKDVCFTAKFEDVQEHIFKNYVPLLCRNQQGVKLKNMITLTSGWVNATIKLEIEKELPEGATSQSSGAAKSDFYILRIFADTGRKFELIDGDVRLLTYLREEYGTLVPAVYKSVSGERMILYQNQYYSMLMACQPGHHYTEPERHSSQLIQIAQFMARLHIQSLKRDLSSDPIFQVRENANYLLFDEVRHDLLAVLKSVIESNVCQTPFWLKCQQLAKDYLPVLDSLIPSRLQLHSSSTSSSALFQHLRKNVAKQPEEDTEKVETITIDNVSYITSAFLTADEQIAFDEQLPIGIVHGDLHDENVLFVKSNNGEGYQLSGVLDWDDCFYGPLVYDVGLSLFCWSVRCVENIGFEWNWARTLIQEYLNSREMSSMENRFLYYAMNLTALGQTRFMFQALYETVKAKPEVDEKEISQLYVFLYGYLVAFRQLAPVGEELMTKLQQ